LRLAGNSIQSPLFLQTVGKPWRVGVISYRLGDRYHCDVDNVSPGARLARGEGKSREEAEKQALDKAREMLSRTRTFPVE
jgi:hypothetical protein